MSQWLALEFECPTHGKFDHLWDKREGNPIDQPCHCGHPSPVVTSYAVRGRIKLGEVSQGKNDQPLPPHILSTEALADGMPMTEWKARNAKARREERRAERIKEGR